MKRLFFWLLKKYSTNETERVEILRVLHEQVRNEYTEQTGFGNVYNSYIEFILANDVIKSCVTSGEDVYLDIIKGGLDNTFDETVEYFNNNKNG